MVIFKFNYWTLFVKIGTFELSKLNENNLQGYWTVTEKSHRIAIAKESVDTRLYKGDSTRVDFKRVPNTHRFCQTVFTTQKHRFCLIVFFTTQRKQEITLLHHFDDFYSQNIDCFYHKKNKLILKGAKHTPFLSDCFYHTKTPFLPDCFFYHTKSNSQIYSRIIERQNVF